MKFFAVAIAALMGLTDAKSLSGRELNARIAKNQLNKKTLMNAAKPYGNTARKLEDAAFEITGEYSIVFDQCVSLQVENENLIDDAYISLASAGTIVAEKSYIMFKVCKTAACYYEEDDSSMTFIVDVGTYVQALSEYIPNQRDNYCTACEENQDYCQGNDEEAADEEEDNGDEAEEDEEAEDEEEDNGERKRAMRVLANVNYIDCDLCTTYNCFEDENGDEEEQDEAEEEAQYEDVVEWLENIAGCAQVEDYTYGDDAMALYGGFICNNAGTGVQIGTFLDEDCEIYLSSKSYVSMMSSSDLAIANLSVEVVEYMFKNEIDCNGQEIEYTNPNAEAADEEEEQEENEEEYQVNEVCSNVWAGDFTPLSLYDCGGDAEEDANEDEEDADEEAAEDQYDWYTYEISQDDLEDSNKVCNIVKSMESSHSNFYSEEEEQNGSGMYDYTVANKSSFSNGAGGLSGGAVAFIVILCVGAAAGAAYVYKGQAKSSSDKKKTPLINGSMA